LNWADKALIGITIVALLAVVVPISIGLAGEDDDLNVTGNFLLNSVYGQTDFGETSSATTSDFESFTETESISLTSVESPPDDIVMTPPPNNIFTGGDTPFNEYTFPPPQPIEITTPVTGLVELPHGLETVTYEKFHDGYTWEVDENGLLYNLWDEERIGSIPEPKPEYPQVTENYTIVQNDDDTFTYLTHDPYIADKHEWKPYIIGEDDQVVQIQTNGGTVVFDKVAGAVTIFNEYGVIVDSDSYMVRTALLDSDVWTNLDVSNADVETVVVEDGDKVTVSFVRENTEGKFTSEYVIHSGNVKTTVYFTNYIYENNKFAFTQTLDLPDNIISVNGMEDIDLNDYVGVSFDRETLEANMALVLKIKNIHYSSGLGFDNLWSVNVVTPTKVSLDYANVDELQTAIGETVELDPTYTLSTATTMSSGQATSAQIGSNSPPDVLGCGGRLSYTQGSTPTWNLRNYIGPWYTWNGCRVASVGFDLSSIPDSAIVSDTKLKYDITWNNGNVVGNLDFNQMTQRGQDGWGLWGSVSTTSGTPQTGDNPYSVYCTTSCPAGGTGSNGAHLKNWEIYLDANNLGPQPNGAGHQYAYNVSPALGTDIVTDLGAQGNADVQAQLKHSTSVDGVGDWFALSMPFSTMKNGATAATNWTSPSVQTANTQDMGFDNVQLQVTYYSPPSSPANVTVTPNGGSVDLAWSASEIYSDYEVSTHADYNPVHIAGTAGYGGTPATCSGGSATATAPTLGQAGVIGTSMYFDGICDTLNPFNPHANSSQGSAMTFAVWMKSDAGSTAMAEIPFGKVGSGFNYLILNGQWASPYGYANNSVTVNGLYSAADAFPPNVWNHYAFTIAADKTTHLYVNGVDIPLYSTYDSANYSASTLTTVGASNAEDKYGWNIGSGYHTSTTLMNYPYIGWMDDMIVWHDVLTPAEITAVYEGAWGHPYNIVGANTLEYYMPFDDSSFPLENYVVLNQPSKYDVTYYIDRDGLSSAITTTNLSVTDTTTSFNTPYVYSLQAYNNAGGGGKWSESPYEVSSDAISGDATNNGATTGVGGIVGNAWYFDGVNDFVDDITVHFPTGRSVSVWINTPNNDGTIIGGTNAGTTQTYVNGNMYGFGIVATNVIPNDSWTHIVSNIDANLNSQIYINGSLASSGTMWGATVQNPMPYVMGTTGGGTHPTSTPYNFLEGKIDELAIYNQPLTSGEVSTLYNNGNPEPVSMTSVNSGLTHYYNFEQTGNTLTNMAVTEDPTNYAITLTVEPPTNLSATLNAPNVDLSWTGGTGATGYKIESSTNGTTWTNVVANTGSATTTYQHTAPVQNTTNYYKVTTLIGSDVSTANVATTALTNTNYRTYIDNASSTSCVATGTIYEDGSRGNGLPTQGSGNRYCESTSMEYDISGIDDSSTILAMDIDEIHNIWSAGYNPSCEYKANTTVQPSTGTGAQKYSATQTGTVYAYDPLCTTTAGTSYNVPLSAQANTDLQNQLSSDWFAISWTMGGFPVISEPGSAAPPSVNSGSATLNVLHTAPASLAVDGTPDAPTGLTTTFNNSTLDMDLAWTAPVNNNGSAVTGYKIETSLDGSTWSPVITTTNTNTTYSHVSPTVGVINYYQISAVNAYGAGNSSVSFVTPSVDTTITLPASTYPSGVATDSSGNTYVSLSSLNQIAVYDSSGTLQNTYGAGGAISCTNSAVNFGNPKGISVDSSGNIWVAEHSCHRVQKLDSSGNHLFYIGNTPTGTQGYTGSGFAYPYDVDFDSNGNAYVVDTGNAQISKYSSGGTFISQFLAIPNGSGNYQSVSPEGIAIDSDGDVYIADRYNHRVSHYDSSGTYIDSIGTTGTAGSTNSDLSNPQGVDVDADDNVYIADASNKRVQKFDSSGTYITSTPTGSKFYNDVAIDSYNIHVVSDERNAEIYGQTSVVGALAGGPPDAPTNLTVSYNSPNADLTWVAPTVTNGSAVIGYKVETSLDNLSWSPITVLTNTNVTYSHTNPTVGVDNYYRVSAINSIGTGVPGNVASVLAALVPTAPLTLTTTQTVPFAHDLSWSVPSNDGGSPVTNYKVYRDGSLITTLGNVTTYQDNTMQHIAHTHSYEVSAVNLVGESPMSNASSITSWNVPDATTGVTATARAGQQNELNWTAPNNGGSPITGYHIKSSTDNITFTDVVATTTTQPYNHTGLTQGTTYYYQISAISAVGEGAFGTASATVGDVPDAPVSLTVVPQAGMQATITITIPNDNGYAISSYTLHRSSDNFATFTVLNSQTSNVIVDYPLNIGTSYQYKALATNSLGDSALSVASATALAGDVPSTPVAPGTVVATT